MLAARFQLSFSNNHDGAGGTERIVKGAPTYDESAEYQKNFRIFLS